MFATSAAPWMIEVVFVLKLIINISVANGSGRLMGIAP